MRRFVRINVDSHQNKEGFVMGDPIVGYYTNLDLSEMELFMCFSSSFVRDFVTNIARKLANRISYQIEMFGRGSKSAKGGPYPLADLFRVQIHGVQIRCGIGLTLFCVVLVDSVYCYYVNYFVHCQFEVIFGCISRVHVDTGIFISISLRWPIGKPRSLSKEAGTSKISTGTVPEDAA